MSFFGKKTSKPNFHISESDLTTGGLKTNQSNSDSKNNLEIKTREDFPTKKKGFNFAKLVSLILILASLFFLGAGVFFAYSIFNTADRVIVQSDQCKNFFDLQCLNLPNPLGSSEYVKLKGQDEGRTNILLIGIDSVASLSDSIILVSYFHNEKKFVTVNIPRDLYVSTSFPNSRGELVYLSEKVNAVYSYAMQVRPDDEAAGANALSELVSKEFEIPVHYWGVTNFEAVEQIVDELGGIEVNVDIAFRDCEFPSRNYAGYIRPCPTFEVGSQAMNGERALIYARSRMSPQDGGDFARSRRQSLVTQGILKKVKEKGVFGNINNIRSYLKIIDNNFKTNVQLNEMVSFYKIIEQINPDTDYLKIIWTNGNGFLCDGPGSAGRGYHILYCGGQTVGSKGNSAAKQMAKRSIKNMLIESQGEELYKSQIVILGNQSLDSDKARNAMLNSGFETISFNNNYRSIKAATATSTEKTTVYIADEKLRDLFSKINPKPDFEYQLEAALPADKVLPANTKEAQIIIWVESI